LVLSKDKPTIALQALKLLDLDSLVELPLDLDGDLVPALDHVSAAGFKQLRVTVERAPAAERTSLILQVAAWQERHGRLESQVSPTPEAPFASTEHSVGARLGRMAAVGQQDGRRRGAFELRLQGGGPL